MLNGVLDDHIVVYGKGLVHMLDFRIHTFLCVCRHMNYTKAAAELQITQPAVSQHIRHLEKEYQTKLFDYTGKRLELTQAGQILLNAATTISHDNVMLKQRLQDLQQNNKSVAFGATHTIGEFEIIDRLADFLHEHADVNIRMKIADTDKLLKAVDEGIIDFAIVEGFFDQDQYETLLFSNEPLIAVCGPDYDAPSEMSLADLMRYRLIVREKSAGTRELLERSLAEHSLTISDFPLRHEVGSPQAVKGLTCRNCGVAFLYEKSVRQEVTDGRLKEIAIRDFSVTHAVTFLWRKGSMYSAMFRQMYNQLKG
ncbi:CysJI operon transcriptional activator [uncultured Ruminococcus sp.]|nr:CysJI operon transcriptional activator [uncultured Ruminococcus sp.]